MHHLLDAHDGHVVALAHDLGYAEGDGVRLLGHLQFDHVEPLVLDEDDGVGIAYGLDEQALGVIRGRGRHDLEAGHVGIERVERLRVLGTGAKAGTGHGAHDHGDGDLAAVDVAHLRGLVEELVERGADEVDVHDLGDGAQAGIGGTDRGTDEAGFGDGRVDDTFAAELGQQTLGHAKRSAPGIGGLGMDVVATGTTGDVLAEDDDALVGGHLLVEGFVDGVLDVELAGHRTPSGQVV